MKLFLILTMVYSTTLLQGCLSAAIIGSAAIATKSAIDSRSLGQQIDDKTLETRINTAINKNKNINSNTRIIITAYEGKVLLTGQVPNVILAKKIEQIVAKIKGVKLIYNEIRQAPVIDITRLSKDFWITTKIKSKIFASNSIKSLATIKVITEAGEVFLLGILPKQESAEITKIASRTNGIKCVITAFTYIN